MVNNAEQTATSAEKSTSNSPGYCLVWSRERAAIDSKYPDATTAWKNTKNPAKHPGDRNPPRGAMVYWTGGSQGYGHIAVSLGGGKIRSSDAGGSGRPATVDLGWVEQHWGLPYAGWADNVNSVTIPGVGADSGGGDQEEDDMPQYDHASTKKSVKLKAGEWLNITWQNVAAGPAFTGNDANVRIGGRRYTSTLHCTVSAPAGATIRLRNVEYQSGEGMVEGNPQTEFVATGGSSYPSHTHVGVVAKDRRLVFRIACTQDATMTFADAGILSW